MILVVNKVDRPDARIAHVVDEVYQVLFLDLDADEEQIEFPIVYCNARAPGLVAGGGRRDLGPLIDLLLERVPARCTTPGTRYSPTSPTSTPRPKSGGSRSAAYATAPSARPGRSHGAGPTGRSSAPS